MDPSLKKPSSGEAAAAAAPVRPQRPFTEYNVSSDDNEQILYFLWALYSHIPSSILL